MLLCNSHVKGSRQGQESLLRKQHFGHNQVEAMHGIHACHSDVFGQGIVGRRTFDKKPS